MLKLYNSLTRKKDEFVPIEKGVVKMYSCGPTVYYYPHIGNMRAYLFMDSLRRVLKFNGFKIDGVMNLTDVGHLTSDEDSGDDKMEVASKRENKTVWEIAKFYTDIFMQDAKSLNIDLPEHIVKATDHIAEMIEFDKQLEQKGFTYMTSDGLYFDVQKFQDYGMLSGKDLKSEKVARIEENTEKHHPFDFALWKKVTPNHIMKWDSPWGVGCPGWHIECSAMGKKYLGTQIDIHTGGIDHLSVHHENEIAQNNACEGKNVVNRWMHVEFLQVDGGKMGKSLGNLFTLKQLEEKEFLPLDYRYFNFSAHYRKKINFTLSAMKAAQISRKSLNELLLLHKNGEAKTDAAILSNYLQEFEDAINDDLNLPLALGVLWKMTKEEKSRDVFLAAVKMDEVFGLGFKDLKEEAAENDFPKEVILLAEERLNARNAKDFAKSDCLREEIRQLGFEIKDSKGTYFLSKI